ncbi:marine proteobacterial sortase target protein [Alteromonas sp. C1M14]|uniref:marine proteobacterial sortase target protein n=1 Tax=Alteromonas sp. C1M14 TaxID=2841567 RepID=UPI001C096E6B|nr:marine proteobacterial sortase target protein [Alteromonas sp. C1M14]MBU2980002.1 marine proteobacterial sortase target protein [Alteromonas sp. C1M14]
MYPKRIPKHLIIEEYPKRKSRSWRMWLVLFIVALVSVGFAFHARATESAGSLKLVQQDTSVTAATHIATDAKVHITGMIATVEYTQTFENPTDHYVEGVYTFPLPEDAAVQHMEIHVDERRIVGEIQEKVEAKRLYTEARQAGKRAALTLQQRANLFTQRVANIPPHQSVTVQIRFLHQARYHQGVFEWRLPTTLTPRYIPGAPLPTSVSGDASTATLDPFGWAMPTDEVPDAMAISPPFYTQANSLTNPLSLSITLESGLPLVSVDALYHKVVTHKKHHAYYISLKEGRSEMDRDFVLQWQPTPSHQPRAALFGQTENGNNYSMLMMLPPSAQYANSLPRDITFIIDTSGSMQGTSMVQAKASLRFAINQLNSHDRFNIIAFSDTHQALFAHPQQVTDHGRQLALNWVARLTADGGTQMYPALAEAFTQAADKARLQQVVFITDGAVGNEAALFKLIKEQAGEARLFTVGIGSAPNSFFMSNAAKVGRGAFEYIAQPQDVQQNMARLFTKLNHATTKNLSVQWPFTADVYPPIPGDLYLGEPLVVFTKTSRPVTDLHVEGDTASEQWSKTVSTYQVKETKGIASLWARQKIEAVEASARWGTISDEEAKSTIIDVALAHHLLSRFTAFVAIDKPIVRDPNHDLVTSPTPNQLPAGQQRLMAFPQTATNAPLSFYLGTLFLGSLVMLQLFTRRSSKHGA